jgi:hypothetical protein
MATTIKLKNSVTTTNAPSSLEQGEVAINVTDKKVWVGNAATSPVQLLGDGGSASFTSVAFADGTAAAPSITNTGDTNTGIFFPAADTIAFSEGGTESMRIDASGNLGLGVTPSAWSATTYKVIELANAGNHLQGGPNQVILGANAYFNSGWKYGGNLPATLYDQNNGSHSWSIAPSGTTGNAITFTQAMTLNASGNLGIGTSSPTQKLHMAIASASTIYHRIQNSAGDCYLGLSAAGNTELSADNTGNQLIFKTVAAERARIDASGNLFIGDNGSGVGTGVLRVKQTSNDYVTRFQNTNAAPSGLSLYYSGAAPNGTGNPFIYCEDNGVTLRMSVRSNGGIANYSGNNVNLSDAREKTNIELAGSYLDKICAIPVKTFNYIDQNLEEDGGLTLGVIAQDVQAVAPELVMESDWGTKDESKMRLSIYQTDLQYALMKAIQEQQAIITDLKARIESLENK